MLPRILILFLFASAILHGNDLAEGMSLDEVRTALGRPESTMQIGSKEVLTYADGTRLEFVDGNLVSEHGQIAPPVNTNSSGKKEPSEPLINAEEIVQQREKRTIGASVQPNNISTSETGQNYGSGGGLESLEAAMNSEASRSEAGSQKTLLQRIAIAFGIEIVITFVVLSIAFQIGGCHNVFRQLLVLSLTVALTGALFDTVFRTGPLNPIRSAVGLLVLIILIRSLTDIRGWGSAIKIALVTRLVSIAALWIAMIGLGMLFRV